MYAKPHSESGGEPRLRPRPPRRGAAPGHPRSDRGRPRRGRPVGPPAPAAQRPRPPPRQGPPAARGGRGRRAGWGGWLADEVGNYLLTCPEVKTNHALRSALTRHANFEAALSELQTTYLQSRSIEAKRNVDDLQNAVLRMFRTMDQGFRDTQFEFQSDGGYMVRTFLNRFDAIFTLNQDYL